MKNKTLLIFFFILFLFYACKKEDKTAPVYKAAQGNIILAEGDPSKFFLPKITLELSDTTFADDTGFNYFNYYAYNYAWNKSLDGYYFSFSPIDKPVQNPAYLVYDYRDTESVTGAKAYRVKYTGPSTTLSVTLTDTAQWNLVNGLQVYGTSKIFRFPVDDLSYVYFMAKKP